MSGNRSVSRYAQLFSVSMCLLLATPVRPVWADVAAMPAVDLELVLTIDCSYSVDSREFALQTKGLAQAFLDPKVVHAIRSGAKGAITISIVEWSNAPSQVLVMPWTVVSDAASAKAVAVKLARMPRLTQAGGTSISAMVDFGIALLDANPFKGTRQAIDISSDGRNNSGRDVRMARDAAIARGITINGLAILDEVSTLNYYFEQFVIGGRGAFVITADGYDDYVVAIRRKLLREISGDKLARARPGRQKFEPGAAFAGLVRGGDLDNED